MSLIGHVTRDELRRHLNATEAGNGFGNRFVWVCVRRARVLPEGGDLSAIDLEPIRERLRRAVQFAQKLGPQELRRDEDARQLWRSVYEELSEGHPGLLGAMTSRAEAQVMRLALIYSLLDQSDAIRRLHLEAALAVWRYCEASARFIFGDALGDPIADEILGALRAREVVGMTLTEIHGLFARHRARGEIGAAMRSLAERGLAYPKTEETGGRPVQRWFATGGGSDAAAK
jgi:hypothetical protein